MLPTGDCEYNCVYLFMFVCFLLCHGDEFEVITLSLRVICRQEMGSQTCDVLLWEGGL